MLVAGAVPVSEAVAQTFPSRPVRLVVPNPSGGLIDVFARLLGPRLADAWGQPALVENRPGGSTIIATEYALKQPADGHTVLFASNSFLINSALRTNLSYDPLRDFAGVSQLIVSPLVFAVPTGAASVPRTLAEFLAEARQRPGQMSFASVGPVSTHHIAGETLKSLAGVNLVYAPYPGGAPAVNAVLGGHVSSVIANYSEVARHVDGGRLRPLAVLTRQRIDALRDVPTVAESGFVDFEATPWYGVVVRAGTPPEAIRRLANDFMTVLRHPEVREKLAAQGLQPVGDGPEAFDAHLRQQMDRLRQVVKQTGISAN